MNVVVVQLGRMGRVGKVLEMVGVELSVVGIDAGRIVRLLALVAAVICELALERMTQVAKGGEVGEVISMAGDRGSGGPGRG